MEIIQRQRSLGHCGGNVKKLMTTQIRSCGTQK